jgi:RNA recognition motif-containing protein
MTHDRFIFKSRHIFYFKLEIFMNYKGSNRLYVGNLSVLIDEATLKNILTVYGTVSKATVVLSDNSRSRRCYAVVEMSTSQEADDIYVKLNGHIFHSRPLSIRKLKSLDSGNVDSAVNVV